MSLQRLPAVQLFHKILQETKNRLHDWSQQLPNDAQPQPEEQRVWLSSSGSSFCDDDLPNVVYHNKNKNSHYIEVDDDTDEYDSYNSNNVNDNDDDDDDDDVIQILYHHHYNNNNHFHHDRMAISENIIQISSNNDTVNDNNNSNSQNRTHIKSSHHKEHLQNIVHDNERLLHSIMNQTNHIYDIRLCESVLVFVVLLNNYNHTSSIYSSVGIGNHSFHTGDSCTLSSEDSMYSNTTSTIDDDAVQIMALYLIDPSIPFPYKLNLLKLLLFHWKSSSLSSLSAFQHYLHNKDCCDYDETSTTAIESHINVSRSSNYVCHDDDEEFVRNMYAFCISLYFRVNDIQQHQEHSIQNDAARKNNNNTTVTTIPIATIRDKQLLLLFNCPMILQLRSKCLHLQEMYTIYDDISCLQSRQKQKSHLSALSGGECDPCWEYIKNYCYDHDSILLPDVDVLHAFYNVLLGNCSRNKSTMIQYSILIASIGFLRICMCHPVEVANRKTNNYKYSEAIYNVALFLSTQTTTLYDQWEKMAALSCLHCNSTTMVHEQHQHEPTTIVSSLKTIFQRQQPKKNRGSRNGTYDDFVSYYSKVLSFCTCKDAYMDSFLVTQLPIQNTTGDKKTTSGSSTEGHVHGYDANVTTTPLCAFYLILWELRVVSCHLIQQQQKERQQRQQLLLTVVLLRHRLLRLRSFFSNSNDNLNKMKQQSTSVVSSAVQLLPVIAIETTKTKVHQIRSVIYAQIQICQQGWKQTFPSQ